MYDVGIMKTPEETMHHKMAVSAKFDGGDAHDWQ